MVKLKQKYFKGKFRLDVVKYIEIKFFAKFLYKKKYKRES